MEQVQGELKTNITASILWQENKIKGGVMGYFCNTLVFPSTLETNPPGTLGKPRTQYPEIGQLETCLLFLNQKGNTYFAFPVAHNYSCIQFPGVIEPVSVEWVGSSGSNISEIKGIIELQDELKKLNITIVPNKFWVTYRPVAGTTGKCKIIWIKKDDKIFGNAYPFDESGGRKLEIEVLNGAISIKETGIILITTEKPFQISVNQEPDGKIIIELEPE